MMKSLDYLLFAIILLKARHSSPAQSTTVEKLPYINAMSVISQPVKQ